MEKVDDMAKQNEMHKSHHKNLRTIRDAVLDNQEQIQEQIASLKTISDTVLATQEQLTSLTTIGDTVHDIQANSREQFNNLRNANKDHKEAIQHIEMAIRALELSVNSTILVNLPEEKLAATESRFGPIITSPEDFRTNVEVAHRMWRYLRDGEHSLKDNERRWLINMRCLAKQEDGFKRFKASVLDRHQQMSDEHEALKHEEDVIAARMKVLEERHAQVKKLRKEMYEKHLDLYNSQAELAEPSAPSYSWKPYAQALQNVGDILHLIKFGANDCPPQIFKKPGPAEAHTGNPPVSSAPSSSMSATAPPNSPKLSATPIRKFHFLA